MKVKRLKGKCFLGYETRCTPSGLISSWSLKAMILLLVHRSLALARHLRRFGHEGGGGLQRNLRRILCLCRRDVMLSLSFFMYLCKIR